MEGGLGGGRARRVSEVRLSRKPGDRGEVNREGRRAGGREGGRRDIPLHGSKISEFCGEGRQPHPSRVAMAGG